MIKLSLILSLVLSELIDLVVSIRNRMCYFVISIMWIETLNKIIFVFQVQNISRTSMKSINQNKNPKEIVRTKYMNGLRKIILMWKVS